MTSASGKSRAVKDPARCSRAVNMTVTAAPVANGQRGEREREEKRIASKQKSLSLEGGSRQAGVLMGE